MAEVEYLMTMKARELKRDILYHEHSERKRNPFAWSPGDVRWQYFK